MGNIFSLLVQFFNRNLITYFVILLGIISILFFGFRLLNLDENIYGIFPKGEKFQKFNKVLNENNLNRQVIFSVDAKGKKYETVYKELELISKSIIAATDSLITDIQVFRDEQDEYVLSHYYDFFPAFLNDEDYKQIEEKIKPHSIDKAMKEVAQQLSSANSIFLRKITAKDPLGLMWSKIQNMNPQMDSSNIEIENGILYSSDRTKAFFTGVLNFELNNNELNKKLNEELIAYKDEQKATGFDYFGPFLISYENARQVKEDTFITMIISLGLILLLLVVYYRSIFTPIFFVLPAVFSGFCGLGLLGYINPNISAISVATSAILLGIVLDYSFHFITHFAHTGDLKKTVKELTFPMLVGSFTTIAAFMALLFTDSIVLQNFGLLALLTLSSAAIFTLLFLPTLIKFTGFKPKERASKARVKMPKWLLRASIFGTLVMGAVFILDMPSVTFDSDLNNLSYHPDELVQKEEFYTGINPKEEKKLYFFVEGRTKEEAIEKNFHVFQDLIAYHEVNGLEEVLSAAPYLIPNSIKARSQLKWESFWKDHIDLTYAKIKSSSEDHDFSEKAFNPFKKWIVDIDVVKQDIDKELLLNLGLSKLVHKGDEKWSIATSVVVNRSQTADLKASILRNQDVYIFDIAEMANTLMLAVQDDFNYLLIFSSLIVLLSLLIIYGRLELALFSFFPMVISWILILYIASWFDIQFNFVNIIVATFIFGLGDDFSIFVTDGLIQKYKTNSDSLSSYKSAIALSGLTTIIGTGALYFAKHPAIHSIAIISVVGISTILFLTLMVQPSLFRFFITNRTKTKHSPITLLGLFYSTFLFTYFLLGCFILNIFLLFLVLFPASKAKKRLVLNYIISKMARSTIYLGFHVRKRYINFEKIDFSKPSIIVANHSSFLDILLMLMINTKTIIMVKKWVYNSPFFGMFIRYSGYLFVEEGTKQNLEVVQERINEGYTIIIFPEGTRSTNGKIGRFHKGAFFLAQQMKLDIQPILIVGADYVNPKNDMIIKSGSLILVALDRIKVGDPMFEQRFGHLTKDVCNLMREQQKKSHDAIFTADYLKKRVMYNFLYKSPITEWYVRVKWELEKKNFEIYDRVIGDRKRIYDIGCGLGYLGYFLHYRGSDRVITGVDYDEDKIAIAANGYDKSDNLIFEHGDVRSLNIKDADAVFFNDVLHYMEREQQMSVLKKTVDRLSNEGMILIRDGITDLEERHFVTEKTERYSTQIIGFNKTTDALSFFSSKDIFNFANKEGLNCEMIEQSKKNSNVLFILRKRADEQ